MRANVAERPWKVVPPVQSTAPTTAEFWPLETERKSTEMMTVAMIGANRDAWGYLYKSIADEHQAERAGEKASYYLAEGTPPGRWAGSSSIAAAFAPGEVVDEQHLSRLFGLGQNPLDETTLGKAFAVPIPLDQRVQARIDALSADLSPDELFDASERIYEEESSAAQQQSVAGFEFVFSPSKSVSAWWALADPEMKDQIRQAHQAAIDATIGKLETDIIRTRTGIGGAAQSEVQGITAALFDHWDSREGDPQLHTHMLVSNRVQGIDGKWRTIDSKHSLMPAVATAGAYYDTVLMDEISLRFGAEWTTQDVLEAPEKYLKWRRTNNREDTPASRHQFSVDQGKNAGSVRWQLADVPHSLVDEYSTRSKQINNHKNELIDDYVKKHGRQPGRAQIIRMRQTATLRTRSRKQVQSLQSLTQSWRQRALAHVGDSFLFADRVKEKGKNRLREIPLWSFRNDDVDAAALQDAAEFVLHELATTRSTWGRTNAETGALRAIAGWRFRSAADRNDVARRVVELTLSQAIPLTPKNALHTPFRFRTADGDDMFHPATRDLYTTAEVWDAEGRLLEAGQTITNVAVPAHLVDAMIGTPTGTEQRILSEDQAAAVSNLVLSGRAVDVLVGPAGAGKTTSLEKLREIWEHHYGHGSVRGLAPTARAAEVLAESLGIETENTAKWLHETAQGTTEKDGFSFQLHHGDLMIVDEASISGTIALDQLRAQAEAAGAKLLLVGDWAQLAAVDAGGAFGLLANDRTDVAELHNLHRFKADWEADASKLLRLGKVAGLSPYLEHGRIEHGLDETIVAAAVEAWKTDEMTRRDTTPADTKAATLIAAAPNDDTADATHSDATQATTEASKGDNAPHVAPGDTLVSLLIAPTNDMVERLNQVARDWRIEQGQVDATREVTIASGTASPGDRIVTRQNARTLRTDHDRWVKNNDEWVIHDITPTGDIVAVAGEEQVVLPAEYCSTHVQLAYATTAHRSQGRTVDTAHTIVDSSASRETFYVAMTRGKLSNRAYVIEDEQGLLGDRTATGMNQTWRDTLERVVLNRGGDLAAHDTTAAEAERIGSIRQLYAEYQTLAASELEREYTPVLEQLGLIENQSVDSPYLGPLLANLRRLEVNGQDVPETITRLLAERELGDARDVLAVLHNRVRNFLTDVRELEHGDARYGDTLRTMQLPTDSLSDRRDTVRLYRALELVDKLGEQPEAALRELLLDKDRTALTDPIGYATAALKRRYQISDSELKTPLASNGVDDEQLLAGLLEQAPVFLDQDIMHGLEDRAHAIQLRAELLVDQAIADNAPWLAELGRPIPGNETEWRQRAVTVACYRDLYSVISDDALGREHAYAKNRERDRHIAELALRPDHSTPTFAEAPQQPPAAPALNTATPASAPSM